MAHDTFDGKNIYNVYIGPQGYRFVLGPYLTGEAGIYAGYVVRRASNLLYLCKSGEAQFGIMDGELGSDLDTAYDSGDEGEVFPIGSKQMVHAWYVAQSPAVDLESMNKMVLSATDGMVKKWAYTDAAEATDSLSELVGLYCGDKATTGSTTNNQIIEILI
jgi:hypothetical protein